jgi:hypothetical protein
MEKSTPRRSQRIDRGGEALLKAAGINCLLVHWPFPRRMI